MQKDQNKIKKKKNCLIVTTLPFAILIKIIINMPEIYFWMLQRKKQTNKQTERCDRIVTMTSQAKNKAASSS